MQYLARMFVIAFLLLCSTSVAAQDTQKKQQPRKEDPFIVTYVSFCKDEIRAKELADDIVMVLEQTQPKEPHDLRSYLDAVGKSHDCAPPAGFDGAFFHWEMHREHTRIVQLPGYRAGVRPLSRIIKEGARSVNRHAAVVAVPLEFALRSERIRGARQMLEFFKQRDLGTFNGPRRPKMKLDI